MFKICCYRSNRLDPVKYLSANYSVKSNIKNTSPIDVDVVVVVVGCSVVIVVAGVDVAGVVSDSVVVVVVSEAVVGVVNIVVDVLSVVGVVAASVGTD